MGLLGLVVVVVCIGWGGVLGGVGLGGVLGVGVFVDVG